MDFDAEFTRTRKNHASLASRVSALESRPTGGPGLDLGPALAGLETKIADLMAQIEVINGVLRTVEASLEALRYPPLAPVEAQLATAIEAHGG